MVPHKIARLPLLLVASAIPCVVSCSAAPSQDGPETTGSSEQAATAGLQECPAASTAVVIELAEGGAAPACPPVPGHGGSWVYSGPTPILTCVDDTSQGRAPFVCQYTWTPDAPASPASPAPPDVGALDALPDVYVAASTGGEGNCALGSLLPYAAILDLAQVTCTVPGHTGPRGCDVCGVHVTPGVYGGHLYLPRSSQLDTVVVGTTNGSRQVVTLAGAARTGSSQVTMAPAGWSYVELPLPALPRGVHYVNGPALGYAYDKPAK